MTKGSTYNRGKRARRQRIRKGVLLTFDYTILCVTVLSALLLIFAYLSRSVSPAKAPFFAFCGLAAPVLYIVNTVLALYWIIRWSKFTIIPVVVLVAGISHVPLLFRIPIIKDYEKSVSKNDMVIMTYNVRGFITESDRGKLVMSTYNVGDLVRNRIQPDIVCFQEFQTFSAADKQTVDSLMGMPYNAVNYKITNSHGGGWGLAVYSNYPIVNAGSVHFENSNNSMMWADVVKGRDTMRIFNNHLQTTSLNNADKEYIDNQEFLVPAPNRDERIRNIFAKVKDNFIIRASQADSVSPLVRESPYKTIVCGDFNDTPMSYTYRTIRNGLSDAFVRKGSGMPGLPYTYNGLFKMFRIDYVLHSKEIKTTAYSTPDVGYSDHKPVVVNVEID